MHKYQLQEQIGRGSYSAVYRALNLQTGQQVAIKHAECKFPKGKHKITN
jgi:serine/threonine protein kinase